MADRKSKPLPQFTPEQIAKFHAKVQKGAPDECWPWIGARFHNGYGAFSAAGRVLKAHRVAYFLATGVDVAPLLICHRCDHPWCENDAHLFPGTSLDNNRDAAAKGHTWRGSSRKHYYGEEHASHCLTQTQVLEIRLLYEQGVLRSELAETYATSWTNVDRIVKRKLWKHL